MVPDSHIEAALRSAASSVVDSLLLFEPQQWGLPPFADAPPSSTVPLPAPAHTATATATATADVASASSAASSPLSQVQAEPESVAALA